MPARGPWARLKPWRWHLLLAAGVALLVHLSLFSDFMPPYRRLFGRVTLDNVLHFAAFAALGLVAPLAPRSRPRALAALAALLALGLALELMQLAIPNRRCQLYDALGNALGLAAGAAAGFALRGRLRRSAPGPGPRPPAPPDTP
ncbi:VanZ family protein [Desulfocurvus sp.]|jgi:VanZ family protein|uniref:VanZ family protein n=1 Tax=Desulfocurvus sp. TaxID=2871698 RepID=UPI0025C60EF3|nr:VanZ family protein [Desulfocurvus sp.]MCK9239288.1 VanZ family protein [Desulfocurvus sp.]